MELWIIGYQLLAYDYTSILDPTRTYLGPGVLIYSMFIAGGSDFINSLEIIMLFLSQRKINNRLKELDKHTFIQTVDTANTYFCMPKETYFVCLFNETLRVKMTMEKKWLKVRFELLRLHI